MHLRPTQPSDVYDISQFVAAANQNDEMATYVCPRLQTYAEDYRRMMERLTRLKLVRPGYLSWVCETDPGDTSPSGEPEEGGTIVGYTVWGRDGTGPVARKWQAPNESLGTSLERQLRQLEWDYVWLIGLDRATDSARFKKFKSGMANAYPEDIFNDSNGSWHLHNVCVHPGYQRRGIAKFLLKWGLDQAQAERVPVCLESSIAGLKLYQSQGFKTLKEIDFDPGLGPVVPIMVWEPESLQGRWIDKAKIEG